MPRLRMRDLWTFKPKEIMQNKKNLFECKDSTSEAGSSLLVKVAATHAGVVNSNHRFYRPDRMQEASHQWTPENAVQAKPVLFEHNRGGDVLGRVRTSRYVDESYRWNGDFPTIKDSIFYDRKIDLYKSVDWIVENLMPLKDYSGLGYIELGLNVTNPDAIAKVLRDEYLTVSVGFTTGQAICSICHQDWAEDDKCDHRPGMTDEESGKKSFLICGDFKYEELSFVNFPADPFAGKISKDALKDSLNRKFFMGLGHAAQQAFVQAAGMSMADAQMDYDVQIVEDHVAQVYDLSKSEGQSAFETEVKADSLTAVRATELKQSLSDWKPESDSDKTKKRSLSSTLNAKIKKNGWTGVDASVNSSDSEIAAAITTSEATDCEIDWTKETLSADETEYFSDEEGLYAEICVEIDAALVAKELTDADVKDAKLSTEARKKLGGSTFCGPNRSFPVPDCAHVTAARRLIGRAKVGDSTKSKILACVSRKASSLGCGSKKDNTSAQAAEKLHTIQASDDFAEFLKGLDLKDGKASDALTHYAGLDKCYKGADDETKGSIRHVHYTVGERWGAESSLEWAKKYLKEKDKDSVLISSKDLADKEDAVNKLTDEVKVASDALVSAKATQGELLKAIKNTLATQIVMYKSLTGAADYRDLDKAQRDAKVEELSKRHVTSLKDAVADIMSELKWSEATSDGKPKNKADEPGKSVADNAQVDGAVTVVDTATVANTETDAEKAKRLIDEEDSLRMTLQPMTPKERRLHLANLSYNSAKSAIKK